VHGNNEAAIATNRRGYSLRRRNETLFIDLHVKPAVWSVVGAVHSGNSRHELQRSVECTASVRKSAQSAITFVDLGLAPPDAGSRAVHAVDRSGIFLSPTMETAITLWWVRPTARSTGQKGYTGSTGSPGPIGPRDHKDRWNSPLPRLQLLLWDGFKASEGTRKSGTRWIANK